MTDDLGTLEPAGDQWRLTFARHLPHSIDKVWRAVTEQEHLDAWFPQRIEGERAAGSALRFVMEGGDAFDGTMVVFDPPTALEIMWGTDRLRIELTADGDGTVLTLHDTFDELGKAARDAAGWHECLELLRCELAGEPGPTHGTIWKEVHPRYVEALGPEAATIGPPAGRDDSTS